MVKLPLVIRNTRTVVHLCDAAGKKLISKRHDNLDEVLNDITMIRDIANSYSTLLRSLRIAILHGKFNSDILKELCATLEEEKARGYVTH